MRHFGLTSGTAAGAQPRSRSPRADTPRELDPSPEFHVRNDDKELAALIFALLWASPFIVASVVLFYLAY